MRARAGGRGGPRSSSPVPSAKSGRPADAVPYLERAIAAGARTTTALNGLGIARLESGDRPGAPDALRAVARRSIGGSRRIAELLRQVSEGGGDPLPPARRRPGGAAQASPSPRRFGVVLGGRRPPGRGEPRSSSGSSATVPPPRSHVLLVTLDTTRADRLGCYGHARARTRRLDRLAAEGVRFAQVAMPRAHHAAGPRVDLHRPLSASTHGVRNNGNFYLVGSLRHAGHGLQGPRLQTAAFVSSFILDRRYGLDRGFDTTTTRWAGASPRRSSRWRRSGAGTARPRARRGGSRGGASGERLFRWLHLYDPHEPYRPPPPFREAFSADPYDGEIAFADAIAGGRPRLARSRRGSSSGPWSS